MKISILILALFSFHLAYAEGTPSDSSNPCDSDVQKFCKDLKPGHSPMHCLKMHKDELSPACKEKGRAMQEKFKEHRGNIRELCQPYLDTVCKSAEGPRKKIQCLQDHPDQLNDACRNALPARK